MPWMDDQVTYMDEREHALVRLFKAYKPVALLYYLPDMSRMLEGRYEGSNVGVWLSDDIPSSEYFTHFLLICSLIDRTFGAGRYCPVVLNSAPCEIKRLFVQHGYMVYARDESDRMSFVISANAKSSDFALRKGQKRELFRPDNRIVELGGWALLKRYSDKRGLLINFRPPTVQA
jgi:hypothetical protein